MKNEGTLRIGISSLRKPKVDAIRLGIKKCPYFSAANVEYVTESVESGVADTPIGWEECMQWASHRVEILRQIHPNLDFSIGIEWGLVGIAEKSYLLGLVYIEDKSGEGHYGFSTMVETPERVHHEVYLGGRDLSEISHEMSGDSEVREKMGSGGLWTDNMITRTDMFLQAFQSAISPFFSQYYHNEPITIKK